MLVLSAGMNSNWKNSDEETILVIRMDQKKEVIRSMLKPSVKKHVKNLVRP